MRGPIPSRMRVWSVHSNRRELVNCPYPPYVQLIMARSHPAFARRIRTHPYTTVGCVSYASVDNHRNCSVTDTSTVHEGTDRHVPIFTHDQTLTVALRDLLRMTKIYCTFRNTRLTRGKKGRVNTGQHAVYGSAGARSRKE